MSNPRSSVATPNGCLEISLLTDSFSYYFEEAKDNIQTELTEAQCDSVFNEGKA